MEYATHILQVCCQGNTLYLLSHNVRLGVDKSLHTHLLHHSLANNNNQQQQIKQQRPQHQRQHQRQLRNLTSQTTSTFYILSLCKNGGEEVVKLVKLRDYIRGNIRHWRQNSTQQQKVILMCAVIQHSELSHSNIFVRLTFGHIRICMYVYNMCSTPGP